MVNGPLIVPVSDDALTPYSTSLICLAFAAGTVKLTEIVLLCPVAVAVRFAGRVRRRGGLHGRAWTAGTARTRPPGWWR